MQHALPGGPGRPGDALANVDNEQERLLRLSGLIGEQTNVTPLDLLARVVLETRDDTVARLIFSSYDEFLRVLIDPASREALKRLPFSAADQDATYGRLREVSREFKKGIDALFFDAHPRLGQLIREYGVF